jgi:hypothetical protein
VYGCTEYVPKDVGDVVGTDVGAGVGIVGADVGAGVVGTDVGFCVGTDVGAKKV